MMKIADSDDQSDVFWIILLWFLFLTIVYLPKLGESLEQRTISNNSWATLSVSSKT